MSRNVIKMSLLFLLVSIMLFVPLGISCNNSVAEISSTAVTGANFMIIPEKVNLFITPEISGQEKTVNIWSDTDWELRYNAAWLDVSPASGLASKDTEVSLKVVAAALEPGDYYTEILVASKTNSSSSLLPVTLHVMAESPGKILDIPVEIELSDVSPGAAEFYYPSVKVGVLESQVYGSWGGGMYNVGDPCLIVSGQFRNSTDNTSYIFIRVEGYNSAGKQTGWCLSSGPLVGIKDYDIPAHGFKDVALLLSWGSDISLIKIVGSISDHPFGAP